MFIQNVIVDTLSVSNGRGSISAATVYGALRGMTNNGIASCVIVISPGIETFSQLIYRTPNDEVAMEY